MSKSGLFAHFGSKEELQLATLNAAAERLFGEVIAPAQAEPEGAARLAAYCERYIDYLERKVFAGGCFFAAAISEFDDRPGAVRDAIRAGVRAWLSESSARPRSRACPSRRRSLSRSTRWPWAPTRVRACSTRGAHSRTPARRSHAVWPARAPAWRQRRAEDELALTARWRSRGSACGRLGCGDREDDVAAGDGQVVVQLHRPAIERLHGHVGERQEVAL